MPTGGFYIGTRWDYLQEILHGKKVAPRRSNYGNSQKKKKTC